MSKYIEHNFKEGQEVICVSDKFPLVKEYGGSGETKNKPKKEEMLVIDEILGEYLRFNKYDTDESFNWWKCDRFAPIDAKKIAKKMLNAISKRKPINNKT